MAKNNEIAIIGAGPAGMAAALQLQRYGIRPFLFEGNRAGGLLWNANLVENYPGFPNGIPGSHLVELFVEQTRLANIVVIAERVIRLNLDKDLFLVETDKRVYPVRLVLVASGTKPVPLSEVVITPDISNRIYYEVFSMLPCSGSRIAIIGAGDAAFDYALSLATENEVLILNRGESLKCLPLLYERICAIPRIRYMQNTMLYELTRSSKSKMHAICKQGEENLILEIDYLLCAIGREPQLDFMASIEPGKLHQLENAGRIIFAGDVRRGNYRQTAIAVGDGIFAGMKLFGILKEF